MPNMIKTSVLLASLLACAHAQAQIYRCTTPGGSTVYSDQPCGSGAQIVKQAPPAPAAVARPSPDGAESRDRPTAPKEAPKRDAVPAPLPELKPKPFTEEDLAKACVDRYGCFEPV